MNKRILKTFSILVALAMTFLLAGCLGGANRAASSSAGDSASSSNVPSATASAASSSSSSASTTTKASASGDSHAESNLVETTYAPPDITVTKNGEYTDKDSVALYIHTYGKVPSNYVTKSKARKAGWVSSEGNLWDVLPGKSIGGGGFYNDEGMVPDAPGREWYECDIDYEGGFRNAKRIVYSNDGLIYYTEDHYNSFERLY